MTALLSHPLLATGNTADWMHNRLTEARGVLANTTQHPESLVILAARVVAGQTDSASECADGRGDGHDAEGASVAGFTTQIAAFPM